VIFSAPETAGRLSKSPRYYFDHEAIKEPAVSELQPRKRPNGLSVEDGFDE